MYTIITVMLVIASFLTIYFANSPPLEIPPNQPIVIGAGHAWNYTIDKTRVTFNIPEHSIDIRVTLNVTQWDTCFLYALLPFKVLSVNAYAVYNNFQYPLSTYYPNHDDEWKEIGTFDSHFSVMPQGFSIINASLQPGNEIKWVHELEIGAYVKTDSSLLAIDDSMDGRKTAIYTFFGGNTEWTDEMISFTGSLGQYVINQPFIVQIGLPSSYYLSNSQPAPIEYFVNSDSRWLMFSMDFLNGSYAQTLVCNFESPQSSRQFLVFLSGVLVTLSVTFALQPFRESILFKIRNSQENNGAENNQSMTPQEVNKESNKTENEDKHEPIKNKNRISKSK
ncbi:MAG: hypothetical protein NWF01_01105 [Candidatus Bathyarchaeota archaeon]|nr:hypothetical protein [Candidatus Bathyarchaeota archaeon]